MAVGDFNLDGVLDLAVANQISNDVSVLLGKGDGTFQAAENFDVGRFPISVAVADFNGDGTPDLAVGNNNSNNVSVLLGNGDGTFQAARNFSSGGYYLTSLAVGDFNGDTVPDLALVNYSSRNVGVLLGNGDGTFQAARNFAAVNSRPPWQWATSMAIHCWTWRCLTMTTPSPCCRATAMGASRCHRALVRGSSLVS